MTVKSYGILLYRKKPKGKKGRQIEVFLIQPNGPHFWGSKEYADVWGFPKGRKEEGEEPLEVAKREFHEEVGMEAPDLNYTALRPLVTRSGKVITIFAGDASHLAIEWNGSKVHTKRHYDGANICLYQETRDGNWFDLEDALKYIGKGQRQVLDDFVSKVESLV